jgi:hypothetical protein
MRLGFLSALALLAGCTMQPSINNAAPLKSQLDYSAVTTFYRIYDAAAGKPDAASLDREYIVPGNAGLKGFIPNRIVSGNNLAKRVADTPDVYAHAKQCLAYMPLIEGMYNDSMRRFLRLYPAARIPPVYVLIGANNSGGTANDAGVLIGLEVVCRKDAPSKLPVAKRLNSLVAHEIVHVSQAPIKAETLLHKAMQEGTAEFITELITGEISNDHHKQWTRGKEAQIERDFRPQLDSTDLKAWIYNGVGTPDKPGDLAYWVGYRIAKSFYRRAPDKKAAIKRLLTDPDVHGILRDSGWSES